MKFTTGIIVVIASMVFFYLRIALLRGRKRRYEREYALKRRKVNGRSKGAVLPQSSKGTPPFGVKSWIMVGVSLILVIFGMLAYNKMTFLGFDLITNQVFLDTSTEFWYIPVALGVVLLSFSIKVDKPDLGDD